MGPISNQNSKSFAARLLWLGLLLSATALPNAWAEEFDFSSGGGFGEDEFLHVDEAFRLEPMLVDGVVQARWEMPDGYYLYRHQLKFGSAGAVQMGTPDVPNGKAKFDDYFGDVEVYYHELAVQLPLTASGDTGQVGITYQGCADAGLCYPPETRWFDVQGATLIPASYTAPADGSQPTWIEAVAAPVGPLEVESQSRVAAPLPSEPASSPAPPLVIDSTEEQLLAGVLADESLWYALAIFFVAGIGLAFTPCVLPMVPILSSIIVGEGHDISKGRAFSLSLMYVLGMAFTYALIGTLVGLFGASLNLQAALQSAPVLIFFAIVFAVLSLSMFGFYELQLPQAWQNRLNEMGNRQQGGKHFSVMIMGSLSSLVVSPCVSAPLAGALIYISTTDDAVLGGSALLSLGLGMGVPLMLVGASGGHWLPRAGAWMDNVKAVFGVLLLAVAVWLLERVVPPAITLGLWAILLLGSGVYLGVLDFAPRQGWGQLTKSVGAVSFLWGVLLLIGAALGANDPLKPLAPLAGGGTAGGGAVAHQEAQWRAVKSIADVESEIARSSKPVVLDLYADWCISCKVMERNVFPDPEVQVYLSQFTLLRADVTANDPIDQALLDNYGLFGPPSFVFFTDDGREMAEVRLQGELGREAFANHLGLALQIWEARNVGDLAANY